MTVEQQDAAFLMWCDTDKSAAAIAREIGATKNSVIGFLQRQGIAKGERATTTTASRCDALHASMDALLAEGREVRKQDPARFAGAAD